MVRRKLHRVVALATALTLVTAGTALADNLNNDADSSGNDTIAVGGSTTITYRLIGNNSPNGDLNGCNVDTSHPTTVTVTVPAAVTATTTTFQFSACGPSGEKTVTFSSSTQGNHAISHAITGGKSGSLYNNNSDFTLKVTGTNRAPQVSSAAADAHGVEGDTLSTSGAFSDPDNDTLTLSVPLGTPGTFIGNSNGTWSWSLATTDDVPVTSVTVTATDTGGLTVTDTFEYSASNANPVVGTVTVTPSSACAVGISAVFTDAGSGDTHTAVIDWGDGTSDPLVDPATSPVTGSHVYATAGTFTITVTVTDDDGGEGSNTGSFTTANTRSAILQPINGDGSSSFKLGSTIPVKITVTDCGGNPVDTLRPVVSLTKTANGSGTVNEVVSSSAADDGNTMRWSSDGTQYIFNLSTKKSQFNAGYDLTEGTYELRVSDSSFFAGDAVASFRLRK